MTEHPRDRQDEPPEGGAEGGAGASAPGDWLPPTAPGAQPPTPPAGQPPYTEPGGQPPYSQPQAPYGTGWGQPGYGAPYAGGQHVQPPYGSPYGQGSPWAPTYYYSYAQPSNTPAVAGFIMSIASIGSLVFFLGLLSPVTLGVSIASTIVSRNGVRKVERGETERNKDLAQWGYWLGIVGIVLSILAAAVWIAVIASAPDVFDDSTPRDRGEPVDAATGLAGAASALAGAASALAGGGLRLLGGL